MTSKQNIAWAETADSNRFRLRQAHAYTVALRGEPGAGKTTLLEQTLRRLGAASQACRCGVIVANVAAERDAQRLRALTDHVVEIHLARLDASCFQNAINEWHDLDELDLLLIETAPALAIGGALPDLGQDASVGVFSVSAGDDKAAEFPELVAGSELILLNKSDLLPQIPFDVDVFRSDVRGLNSVAPLIEVSAARGTGLDEWVKWLRDAMGRRLSDRTPSAQAEPEPEWYFG